MDLKKKTLIFQKLNDIYIFCSITKEPLQNVQDSFPSLKRKSPESEIAENETPEKGTTVATKLDLIINGN